MIMSSGPETASVSEKQLDYILRRVRIWLLHTPCRDVSLPILMRKLDYKLSVRHDFVSFVSPCLKEQFYIVSTASAALYQLVQLIAYSLVLSTRVHILRLNN